jgi:CheY-like chemotaxis protein
MGTKRGAKIPRGKPYRANPGNAYQCLRLRRVTKCRIESGRERLMGTKLIILVAEDNVDETFLLKRAFQKNGIDLPVHISPDGEDAMAYLKGEGHYRDRTKFPFPRVLITDLKMPKKDGFEVLAWLQNHPECNLIPKIVLSASSEESDVNKAYQLGANCYFTKPSSFDELCNLVALANKFWLTAELPKLPENC